MTTYPLPEEKQAAIAKLKERRTKEGITLREAHDLEVAETGKAILFHVAKEAIEAEESR